MSWAILDHVIKHKDAFDRLAHEGESTVARRQISVAGFNKLTNRTTKRDLDAMAVDLLKRSFPSSVVNLNSNDDEILTFFGFRSGPCRPDAASARAAFVERTVVLQLIIRRGIEVHKNIADSGGTYNVDGISPLFILSV